MKPQKKAESLAAVIISVFILSIALLWIMNIVSFSKDTAIDYETEMFKHIIKSNSESLIKAFDYDNLENQELFYIYKDTENKQYRIMTGSTNSWSKYVDKLWNRINDLDEGIWKTYKREFIHKSDILKHRIDPPEIPNIIYNYDAQNIDLDQNSTLNDGDAITIWKDSANNHDAIWSWIWNSPILYINEINWHPWVKFDGLNDFLRIEKNAEINNDDVCDTNLLFNQKSFTMVIKTSDDVTSEQAIYEQWWVATGYNFMIRNWDLYAWVHNVTKSGTNYSCYQDRTQDRDDWHKAKSISLGEALPNTVYYVTVVQDSNNFDINGNPIDSLNKLQIFLNWELVIETDHVDPQPEHDIWGLWAVYSNNVEPWKTWSSYSDGREHNVINCSECNYFKWTIWEFISWNHALTKAEVRGIHNYLLEKWLHWKQNVNYSIIDINISKYNSN